MQTLSIKHHVFLRKCISGKRILTSVGNSSSQKEKACCAIDTDFMLVSDLALYGDEVRYIPRKYLEKDQLSIQKMCANVYGGMDYIPNMLKQLSESTSTIILVLEDTSGGQIDALVCAKQLGSALFLYGLRVREEARGRGLGYKIMDLATRAGHSQFSGLRHVITATIVSNIASRSIIKKLGLRLSRVVPIWPQEEFRIAYRQRVSFPGRTLTLEDPSILDEVPGARAQLSSDPIVLSLLDCWERPRDIEQVAAVVRSIRAFQANVISQQPAMFVQGEEQVASCCISSQNHCSHQWLPFQFEPIPVDSEPMQELIDAGQVWVLTQGEENGVQAEDGCRNPGGSSLRIMHTGVLILGVGEQNQAPCAGILATSTAAIHSALLKMDTLWRPTALYVDAITAPGDDIPITVGTTNGSVPRQMPPEYLVYELPI